MEKDTIIRKRPEADAVFDTVVPPSLEERVKDHTILETKSKKSVLIVDNNSRILRDLFTDATLQSFVQRVDVEPSIEKAFSLIENRRLKGEPRYDVVIVDTNRGTRDSHSTAFLPVSGQFLRSYNQISTDLSSQNRGREILPGVVFLKTLWESSREDRQSEAMVPPFRILVDRKREDRLVSFRCARDAIENGCFAFYQEPSLENLVELFLDLTNRYKPPLNPQIVTVCGASTSGKSSICRHLAERNPYVVRMPKYTTRPLTRRDWLDGDTKAVESYPGDIKRDGIWWKGDQYVSAFSRVDITRTLNEKKHCVLSIGRPGLLDYLDTLFPGKVKRVIIVTDPERKEYMFEKDRQDSATDLRKALKLESELMRMYRPLDLMLANVNFYNVLNGIQEWITHDFAVK